MSEDKYYVYELRRPWGTPFYIGKGRGDRLDKHFTESHSQDVNDIIAEIKLTGGQPKAEIVYSNTDESKVLEEEARPILQYGRMDNGTGPLVNKNNGVNSRKSKERQLLANIPEDLFVRVKKYSAVSGLSIKKITIAALEGYFESLECDL